MMAGRARTSLMAATIPLPGLSKPSLAQRRGTSLVWLILSTRGKAGSGLSIADSWKLTCIARGRPSSLLMSRKISCRAGSGLGGWVSSEFRGEWRPWGAETARGGCMSG